MEACKGGKEKEVNLRLLTKLYFDTILDESIPPDLKDLGKGTPGRAGASSLWSGNDPGAPESIMDELQKKMKEG